MTILPLSEVQARLAELVGRVHDDHERVRVTVDGRTAAILIAPDILEALEETLDIMSEAATRNRLAESDAQLALGEYVSADELAVAMTRRQDEASDEPAGDPYELRTTLTVRRALGETLPEHIAQYAYRFVRRRLLADPYRFGTWLLPPMDDMLSARHHNCRVIYRVNDWARVVTVMDVSPPWPKRSARSRRPPGPRIGE